MLSVMTALMSADHKLDHYKPWTCPVCKGVDYADLLAIERGNGSTPVEYGTTVTVPGHAVTVEDLPSAAKKTALELVAAGWEVKCAGSETLVKQPPFASGEKKGQLRPDKAIKWSWIACRKGVARATLTFKDGRWHDAVIEDPITSRAVCKVKSDFEVWRKIF